MQTATYVMVCALALALVSELEGYSSGAPTEVCEDITPQHGTDPQRGEPPYKFTLEDGKRTLRGGEVITLTIAGKDATKKFKGFAIQARDVNNKRVGSFQVVGKNAKLVTCSGGSNNMVTHNSPDEKSSVSVRWTAPKNLNKPVHFLWTVAKNGGEYWVKQKSATVMVQ